MNLRIFQLPTTNDIDPILLTTSSFNIGNEIIIEKYDVMNHKYVEYFFENDKGEKDGPNITLIDDSNLSNLGYYSNGKANSYQYSFIGKGDLNFSTHYINSHSDGFSYFFPDINYHLNKLDGGKKLRYKTIEYFTNDTLLWEKEILVNRIDTILIK